MLVLRDTAGIHNIHGMPGILAGLATILFTAVPQLSGSINASVLARGPQQPAWQLAALATSLGCGLAGGTLTGWLISTIGAGRQQLETAQLFDDLPFWVKTGANEACSDDDAAECGGQPALTLTLA
jgi:ammonium transporter Rh